MLFQLNPSSSMIINRARLTSAAGETRDRVNDTNARRSSLVRLKTDCMLHIVLLKSMLHNTSEMKENRPEISAGRMMRSPKPLAARILYGFVVLTALLAQPQQPRAQEK